MFDSLTASDWVIAASTLLGPVLAVQAQKWVERITELKRQKIKIFETLMVTRATQLAPEHVVALNAIELYFSEKKSADRAVLQAWRLYYRHLGVHYNESSFHAWDTKRADLLLELLIAMAKAVGVDANKERILGVYRPSGHFEREQAQLKIIENAAKVLAGEQPIRMSVVDFPVDQDAVATQRKLQQEMLNLVTKGPLRVVIIEQSEKNEP